MILVPAKDVGMLNERFKRKNVHTDPRVGNALSSTIGERHIEDELIGSFGIFAASVLEHC